MSSPAEAAPQQEQREYCISMFQVAFAAAIRRRKKSALDEGAPQALQNRP
jgi:hypothetical protein